VGLKDRLQRLREETQQQRASAPRTQSSATLRRLPADIVARMERYGRVRFEGLTTDETDATEQRFRSLSQREKEAYVDALATVLGPVGGWPCLGAANLLVKTMFEPEDHRGYAALLMASLEFQRAARVSEIALSIHEMEFWHRHAGSDAEWLEPRFPPTREEAAIAAFAIGEEREICRYTGADDSNRVFVALGEDNRYRAVVDQPINRVTDPRRVRSPIFESGNAYDVYAFMGKNPMAHYWNHPELEPFCLFGRPR
jgi:hypothetical protein